MSDLRTQPRIAAHYRLIVRYGGIEGHGQTENLSERGAMISVDFDPPLAPSNRIELELALPQPHPITLIAVVRWASAVLPGMLGVEFDPPISPELLAHVAELLADH